MSFRITGLDPQPFAHLRGLSDAELTERGVKRYVVDQRASFPDRIELRDLELGETVLLLNYTHQPAATPFQASHAIFIGEQSRKPYDRVDEIPQPLLTRPISLRAFDNAGMMIDAELASGDAVGTAIEMLLGNASVEYVHAHYALRGCYAARIARR